MPRQSNHSMFKGQSVKGQYYGRDFTGVITEKTCVNERVTWYLIDLDAPIETSLGIAASIVMDLNVKDELSDLSDRHWVEAR